ncbi:toxin TcdB middle/N-terminal domain-containing protein, partial [Xaviernesmea oryzae]|uniref:toxin TcdB middle/N-terminal domain-containing protein n=1 Tax=Xaviernesmea oryzae TaxID=464029 RepID=UPI0011152224
TQFTNTFLPQVLHAVSQIRVDDGRGQVATTDYDYAGGLYDQTARKFLGYRTITMTKPAAFGETSRPVVTTTYRQDLASAGLPETIVSRNGDNTASKTVVETYQVNATQKPYTRLNVATDTTYSDVGGTVTLRKARMFNSFGNLINLLDYGRTDVTGDETWTGMSYTPNTSAYIVSLPDGMSVRRPLNNQFDASAAVFEKLELYYYDGATNNATPPQKGNLTAKRRFRAPDPAPVSYDETFAYDSYGNKIAAIDGQLNRTEWDYDQDYHINVVRERAPKYFANGNLAA